MALVALGGQQRDTEHGQHVQQMQVIVLVRHRKADQVKVTGRSLRLNGKQRCVGIAVAADVGRVRQKDALTQGVRALVDEPVDCLQAQV